MKQVLFLLFAFVITFATPSQAQVDSSTIKTRSGAQKVEGLVNAASTAANAQVSNDPTPEKVTIEAPATVTIDYSNPDTFYSQGIVGFLSAAVLSILGVLGSFIPGLRSIAAGVKGGKFISSGVVIFLAMTALVTFREGAFTQEFVKMITREFFPAVGYAGSLYAGFQFILNWIKGRKKEQPATV